MATTERRWSGTELREYVWKNLPDWTVITRKPTNHYCRVFNRKTGFVISKSSNYEMINYLTSPSCDLNSPRLVWTGFDFVPYDDEASRKSAATKAAEYALYWIEEAAEFQCPNTIVETIPIRLKRTKDNRLLLVIDRVEYGKP